MIFQLDQLLFSLSMGLDAVEHEVLGTTTNHGKRIAILVSKMGKHLGLERSQLIGLFSSGLLHDNAVSEHRLSIQSGKEQMLNMRLHSIRGEENAMFLPFPESIEGYIKYHHEFVDRSGPFGLDANTIPLGAQLIAIADDLDMRFDLSLEETRLLENVTTYIKNKRGVYYTKIAADAMLEIMTEELIRGLRNDSVDAVFHDTIPQWIVNKPAVEIMKIAEIIGRITDYKSTFTAKHSTQIANRAYLMAHYYDLDEDTCAKIYIAAAFHDIGKLMIPIEILEKPGKLTDEEFEIIKSHVHWSYIMLKDIAGLEEICKWAVTHHRKLNGTGYPDLPAIYLVNDFVCRLMTCIDIYQAVREPRPYHTGRTHEETMVIMNGMVEKGEIDKKMTNDLDTVMACITDGDGNVPDPFTEEYRELLQRILARKD